jgi:HEAT repeat protein
MYKSAVTLLGLVLFFFVMTSYGFNKSDLKNTETRKAAITNLLIGLKTDNYGLRTSSAFMLGELKAEEAVIPLMRMLRTDKLECARIVAALALFKIDNPRGNFAVKQAIRFDDSERVKKMCSHFYNEKLRIKYGIDGNSSYDSEVAIK